MVTIKIPFYHLSDGKTKSLMNDYICFYKCSFLLLVAFTQISYDYMQLTYLRFCQGNGNCVGCIDFSQG